MSGLIRMVINGQAVDAQPADGDMNLIDFLHERRDLTGTKLCCGIGVCRACTVGTRNLPDAPMEKKVNIVVLHAVGGAGKTALMRQFLDGLHCMKPLHLLLSRHFPEDPDIHVAIACTVPNMQ